MVDECSDKAVRKGRNAADGLSRFAQSCARAKNRFYAGSWLEHLVRLIKRQQVVVLWW